METRQENYTIMEGYELPSHGLIYDAAFLWSKKIQLSLHLVQKYE